MKSWTVVTTGGVFLLIVAGAMLLPQSEEARRAMENPRTVQVTPPLAKNHDRGSVLLPEAEPVGTNGGLPDDERSAILNTIEQASVTYDSKALPLIEPYLLHPDAGVRMAAMNGMIVLGEAAAGPLLRKAAETTTNPREAVALAEAADFVELPSGSFVPKVRTLPGSRKPLEGEPGARPRRRHIPPATTKEDPSVPVE